MRYEHSIWCSKAIQIRGENVETINSFQSTFPVGGSDIYGGLGAVRPNVFQSTLPMGGATIFNSALISGIAISIHAP